MRLAPLPRLISQERNHKRNFTCQSVIFDGSIDCFFIRCLRRRWLQILIVFDVLPCSVGDCKQANILSVTGLVAIYRMSQEERNKLREGVPYVKLYRYNPKHLCPKSNGYWDNGQIKLWTSFGSTNDSCQLVNVICICWPVRHTNCWRSPEMHIPAYVRQVGRQAGWRHRSAVQCDV